MSEHKKDTTGDANWDDDDYVAQLLAKDARDCSLRYSALGVYGPSKRYYRYYYCLRFTKANKYAMLGLSTVLLNQIHGF